MPTFPARRFFQYSSVLLPIAFKAPMPVITTSLNWTALLCLETGAWDASVSSFFLIRWENLFCSVFLELMKRDNLDRSVSEGVSNFTPYPAKDRMGVSCLRQ